MTEQLDEFRDALTSGDPDEVNSAIERIEEMAGEERAELFDDAFEMCLDLYEDGDGYQRQSVARFVRELISSQQLLAIFKDETESDLPEHLTLDKMEAQVSRLEAFFVAALEDDDGRVRLAAIKGLKNISVAYQMGAADDRLDDLLNTLNSLMAETSGKKREHIERARNDVQLRSDSPGLEEILSRIPEGES